MNTSYKKTCLSVDCPERTGGECIAQPDNTQWLDDALWEVFNLAKNPNDRSNRFTSVNQAKQAILSHIQANSNPEDGRIYLDIDLVKRDFTPNSEVERLKREAEDEILDERMTEITSMISDFIQSTWPDGDVFRASERTGVIDYDPLVRKIRDFANDNRQGGRILGRAISAVDKAIEQLSNQENK